MMNYETKCWHALKTLKTNFSKQNYKNLDVCFRKSIVQPISTIAIRPYQIFFDFFLRYIQYSANLSIWN